MFSTSITGHPEASDRATIQRPNLSPDGSALDGFALSLGILYSQVEFGCKLSQPIETNSLSFLGSKKLRFVLSGQKLMKV